MIYLQPLHRVINEVDKRTRTKTDSAVVTNGIAKYPSTCELFKKERQKVYTKTPYKNT